jgi:hypothetical protein
MWDSNCEPRDSGKMVLYQTMNRPKALKLLPGTLPRDVAHTRSYPIAKMSRLSYLPERVADFLLEATFPYFSP